MTADLARLDLEREARFKKTFDHQLGQLGSLPADKPTGSTAKPAVTTPAGLAGLFAGGSLQQAFVLSEIFRRPEDRW